MHKTQLIAELRRAWPQNSNHTRTVTSQQNVKLPDKCSITIYIAKHCSKVVLQNYKHVAQTVSTDAVCFYSLSNKRVLP